MALCVALPLLVVLAVVADGGRSRAAVIIYAVGLCSMLAVSTTYHRWVNGDRARRAWQRADHATIFVAIAGTISAVALISLPTGHSIAVLIVIWVLAVSGAAVKVVGLPELDGAGTAMYLATGWTGLLLAPPLLDFGAVPFGLVLLGGVLYTVGAIGFRFRWPRLSPATFSYHEVWHAFTTAAAGSHLAAIWILATA